MREGEERRERERRGEKRRRREERVREGEGRRKGYKLAIHRIGRKEEGGKRKREDQDYLYPY